MHTDKEGRSTFPAGRPEPLLKGGAVEWPVARHRAEQLSSVGGYRFVFLFEDGEPLTKDGLGSAWQRLILKATEAGGITEKQRFRLHDKRKGVTDTKGTKRDKQDAVSLIEAMLNVYDLSVPLVPPANAK